MNRDRVLQVADAIEHRAADAVGFNMGVGYSEEGEGDFDSYPDHEYRHCKSVGCIGGWTNLLFESGGYSHGDLYAAQRALELTDTEAEDLFYGTRHNADNLRSITPEYAVAVLRDFAATGQVRWDYYNNAGTKIRSDADEQ